MRDEVVTAPAVQLMPQQTEPTVAACRCGHDAAAHEHYRAGSDCGACGAAFCGRYRPAGRKGLLGRWLSRR